MTEVRVSDHAVLRYLERAGGFEIDRLRAEIGNRLTQAYVAGQQYYELDGMCFVVRAEEGTPVVTTVIDPRAEKPDARRKSGGRK